MDAQIRRLKLEEVIKLQAEVLKMAVDWGHVWQHESAAPNGHRLSDFYLKIAQSIAILKNQLQYEMSSHEDQEVRILQ